MADAVELTALFTDLGPLLGEAAINEYGEERTWEIILAEDVQIVAELDAGGDYLMLSAEVGTVLAERSTDTGRLLLMTNSMWKETGRIRFGLIGNDGTVVQMLDVRTNDLDPVTMFAVLAIMRSWKIPSSRTPAPSETLFPPKRT